jgi:hypothetical protein
MNFGTERDANDRMLSGQSLGQIGPDNSIDASY